MEKQVYKNYGMLELLHNEMIKRGLVTETLPESLAKIICKDRDG
jgi:hypothetical protein